MQVHGSTYPTVYSCGKTILRAEGLAAFYASYPTTLMMTIPFQSIYFPTYEFLGTKLNPSGTYNPKAHIISGGLAGGLAALITTPLDCVKTVLQTRGTDPTTKEVSGMGQAIKIIYRESGGVKGFMKGAIPRVIAHMPSTAICFFTYESIKHFLHRQNGCMN
jgi:solute carrier family 25 iron transporter 28/37